MSPSTVGRAASRRARSALTVDTVKSGVMGGQEDARIGRRARERNRCPRLRNRGASVDLDALFATTLLLAILRMIPLFK